MHTWSLGKIIILVSYMCYYWVQVSKFVVFTHSMEIEVDIFNPWNIIVMNMRFKSLRNYILTRYIFSHQITTYYLLIRVS